MKLTRNEKEFKERVRGILEVIVSGYGEEEAAENILADNSTIISLMEDVEEGTPIRIAVRQALQDEVIRLEDKSDYSADFDYDYDEYHSYQISMMLGTGISL